MRARSTRARCSARRGARLAHAPRRRRDGARSGREPAEGVEDGAVGDRLDQGAVVVLAVDFHKRRADRFQHLHADRLVVDEGPRAAVRELQPAQDEIAFGVDGGGGGDGTRRMVEGRVEACRDLPLPLVVADEAAVAAAAEGQREGVEEDGLAGPGLAGQDAEAVGEVQLQPVDQDDVADRKLDQHPGRSFTITMRLAWIRQNA